ncbi:MAG: hypothetical protein NT157_00240 [Candidatus Micrarchaeota archaeon]|nr:hypothetical protein [Candidatus Micrarchaeota archaeon]
MNFINRHMPTNPSPVVVKLTELRERLDAKGRELLEESRNGTPARRQVNASDIDMLRKKLLGLVARVMPIIREWNEGMDRILAQPVSAENGGSRTEEFRAHIAKLGVVQAHALGIIKEAVAGPEEKIGVLRKESENINARMRALEREMQERFPDGGRTISFVTRTRGFPFFPRKRTHTIKVRLSRWTLETASAGMLVKAKADGGRGCEAAKDMVRSMVRSMTSKFISRAGNGEDARRVIEKEMEVMLRVPEIMFERRELERRLSAIRGEIREIEQDRVLCYCTKKEQLDRIDALGTVKTRFDTSALGDMLSEMGRISSELPEIRERLRKKTAEHEEARIRLERCESGRGHGFKGIEFGSNKHGELSNRVSGLADEISGMNRAIARLERRLVAKPGELSNEMAGIAENTVRPQAAKMARLVEDSCRYYENEIGILKEAMT